MLLDTEGVATGDYTQVTSKFSDLGNLDATQKSLLGIANQFDVMNGTSDTAFEGTRVLTRAQACVILCSLLDLSEANQLQRDNYNTSAQPSQSAIQKVEAEKQAQAEAQTTTPSTSTDTTTTNAPGRGAASEATIQDALNNLQNGITNANGVDENFSVS